jgi:hypothetical protein
MQRTLSCLLFLTFFYACNNDGHKNDATKTAVSAHIDSSVVASTNTATDVRFKQFWDQFKQAVKSNNMATINKFVYFPIHNLHQCYLPTAGKTRATDTAGLTTMDFDNLSKKVFDEETLWLTSTPADSLYLYEKKNDDKNLPLARIVDTNTPVYEYAVVYNQGNTGGNKSLFFGSVKGKYKLIWIECDGNVSGHTH